MLNEAKLACQAMDEYYEPELCRLISAALIELRTRGVTITGTFTYTTAVPQGETMPKVTNWTCTITDDWIRTAVLTYVKAKVPWTENPEKFEAAFENMLDKIMHTTGYREGWESDNG